MSPLPPLDSMACLDVRRIHQWLAEQTAGMVDDVSLLVGLETPSDNVMLLDAGLVRIESWVTERLGPPGHRTAWASNDYGDVLMLDYPGTGTNRLVALAHYDTVFDTGTVQARPVCVDGDVVTGPGVFDMKGGLVQLVWAVRALDRLGVPRPCVRLVLNGDEEIGSPFSRAILEDVSRGADAALILESSVDGAVKTARKGVGLFRVNTATGVEAHAGLEPERGASAVDEIARVVIALHGGADLDQGTSINVGVVRGGSRPNVVAGAATADLDVRVSSATEQARIEDLLASLRPRDERVRLELSGGWNDPSWCGPTASPRCMSWPARPPVSFRSTCRRHQSVAPATATSLRRWGFRCWTASVPSEPELMRGMSGSASPGWWSEQLSPLPSSLCSCTGTSDRAGTRAGARG